MTRVGLVGYGSSGAGFHAPLLREAGLDLVAVVTGNPERADQARAENPGVVVVPDLGRGWWPCPTSMSSSWRPRAVATSSMPRRSSKPASLSSSTSRLPPTPTKPRVWSTWLRVAACL
jgi:hypothetical protein